MLKGERVVLRPFRPDDVEPLWRARLDPLARSGEYDDVVLTSVLRSEWPTA